MAEMNGFDDLAGAITPEEEAESSLQMTAAPLASDDAAERGIGIPLDDDQLKEIVEDLSTTIEGELDDRETLEARWKIEERLYKAEPQSERKNYPIEDASNVVVPYIATKVDQIVARIMQAIFATEPHWTVTQVNRTFAALAKPVEQYLDFCQREMWDQYGAVKNFVQEIVKKGTGILTVDWRDEVCYRYDIRSRSTVEAGRKLGPRARWVPRECFLMPKGYVDPSKSPWVAEKQRFSLAELRSMEFQQIVENVDELAKLGGDSRKDDTDESAAPLTGNAVADSARMFDIWRVWFRRDLDGDGYPEDYVAHVHPDTRTILRLRPNPYITSMRPYVVARFIEVEGEFDGIGACFRLRDTQSELSTIHNQRRDNATLANTRMFKSTINGTIGDTIRPKHGKVLKMMNPQTDLLEMKLSDSRQVDAFEENITRQAGDEAIGMNDVSNANVTSPVGRAAATTIMAVLQEGSRRFDLNTSEIRRALSEEAHQVVEMFQTHGLPPPESPVSPEAFFGGDAEPAAYVRAVIGRQDDVRGVLRIKLNASTAAINKEIEKQSSMQLYQVQLGHMQQAFQAAQVVANPQIPPPIREFFVKAFKGLDDNLANVFQAFGRFDLEQGLVGDLLAQVHQETNMLQMQQEQMAAQGTLPPPQQNAVPAAPPAPDGVAPQQNAG